jgi:hypothetical protein
MSGDSFWARNLDSIIISAVSLIVGATISWMLARRAGPPKTVDVVIKENTLILTNPATTAGERLRVTWGGEPLRYPRLIRLRLINSGRRVVRASDFDPGEALWVTVQGAVIKAPDLLAQSGGVVCRLPPGPDDQHCVGLLPESLKRREWVDVQLVVDGEHYERLSVSARCDLSREPQVLTGEPGRTKAEKVCKWTTAASFLLLLLLLYILGARYPSGRDYGLRHSVPGVALLVASYATLAVMVVTGGAWMFLHGRSAIRSWRGNRYLGQR